MKHANMMNAMTPMMARDEDGRHQCTHRTMKTHECENRTQETKHCSNSFNSEFDKMNGNARQTQI